MTTPDPPRQGDHAAAPRESVDSGSAAASPAARPSQGGDNGRTHSPSDEFAFLHRRAGPAPAASRPPTETAWRPVPGGTRDPEQTPEWPSAADEARPRRELSRDMPREASREASRELSRDDRERPRNGYQRRDGDEWPSERGFGRPAGSIGRGVHLGNPWGEPSSSRPGGPRSSGTDGYWQPIDPARPDGVAAPVGPPSTRETLAADPEPGAVASAPPTRGVGIEPETATGAQGPARKPQGSESEPAPGRFGGRLHRPPTSIESGQRLGEVLYAARERKGVDLYRAERDTKIRARYLGALERGDYAELPGSVYTKGFLRNYAQYLGLEPEVTLQQYHREYGAARGTEQVPIVPRALETPRSGFTLTPGLAVGAVLVLAIIAFGAYIVLQLFRFAKPPTIEITYPTEHVSEIAEAESTVISGTSEAGVTITIQGAAQQPYRVSADSSGAWEKEVPLTKGRNEFTITATDPETAKDSDAVTIIITVPIPVSQAPTLTVTSPNDGAAFANAAIPVQGQTNASSVQVSAKYLGSTLATPAPSTGKATAKPTAKPTAPATPAAKTIKVASDGTFDDSYQLAPGKWSVTITATGENERTTTETRTVTVAFTGVNVIVELKARAWIKVWVDGKVDADYGADGKTIAAGKTLEFTGKKSVEIRTGSSGATFFTVNGVALGALGDVGAPETWLFSSSAAPKNTDRR